MKVAVLKTSPSTVVDDYGILMDLAGFDFPKSKETVLKLNLSWSLFYPACSTTPWQLDGVLNRLTGHKLHAMENKTVVTDVLEGARNNKWLPVLKKYGLEMESLVDAEWVKYKPRDPLPALDRLFPDGHRIPKVLLGKNVIHLPTFKTHGHTTMTGAVKNAFGGLITERRHHSHKIIHEVLVDLLALQKMIHPKLFAVMDGTVCGDGNGPRTMRPVIKNLILASEDSVALDAIAAKMMGFDPMKIGFIRMAHERGLGCGDVDQIEVVGEDISKINFGFTTGKSPVIWGDQLFRKGALSFLEPMLFHTKLFRACVFGSAFYHDKVWYNTVGKGRIKEFMETDWGKKFSEY